MQIFLMIGKKKSDWLSTRISDVILLRQAVSAEDASRGETKRLMKKLRLHFHNVGV